MTKSANTLIVSMMRALFAKGFLSLEKRRTFLTKHVTQSRSQPMELQNYICTLKVSLVARPIFDNQR